MARTFFGVLGVVMVVTFGGFAFAFAPDEHTATHTLLRTASFVVSGLLLAVGGLAPREWLGTVRPRYLIGSGVLIFGVATVVGGVLEAFGSGVPASSGDVPLLLTYGVLGLVFTVMGIEYLRGGSHLDVTGLE